MSDYVTLSRWNPFFVRETCYHILAFTDVINVVELAKGNKLSPIFQAFLFDDDVSPLIPLATTFYYKFLDYPLYHNYVYKNGFPLEVNYAIEILHKLFHNLPNTNDCLAIT